MASAQNDASVVLVSAARTATTNSTEQENHYGRGVMVVVDVTTVAGGALTLTPVIQTRTLDSVAWKPIWTASTGIDATGAVAQYIYVMYPGAIDSDSTLKDMSGLPLPRNWRLSVTHTTGQSITYSATAYVIL